MILQEKEKMIQKNEQFIKNCLDDYIAGRRILNEAMLNTPFRIIGVPPELSLKEKISYFYLITRT